MYKIIGADGKEYGPITPEQLRQWIAEGRVSAATKVKTESDAGWQTLGTLPDFARVWSTPPALASAAMPSATAPPRTSGLAITSLVLGVLGLFSCGFTALFGLILGLIGLNKIKKSEGRLTGSGLAIAGIVTSGIFLLLLPFLGAAMLLPALAKAKVKAQAISCMNNARQVTLGIIMYAGANTNTCPRAATWCDDVLPQLGTERVFQCSAGDKAHRSHFAYNTNLDGFDFTKITDPATTVMIFEAAGGWNVSGGSELVQKSRHNNRIIVGFADGHVETITESQLSDLNWEPKLLRQP